MLKKGIKMLKIKICKEENRIWGKDQLGHFYANQQSHHLGQTILRKLDDDNYWAPTANCRITTQYTDDGSYIDTFPAIINCEDQTIRYHEPKNGECDIFSPGKPYKIKELILQDINAINILR